MQNCSKHYMQKMVGIIFGHFSNVQTTEKKQRK